MTISPPAKPRARFRRGLVIRTEEAPLRFYQALPESVAVPCGAGSHVTPALPSRFELRSGSPSSDVVAAMAGGMLVGWLVTERSRRVLETHVLAGVEFRRGSLRTADGEWADASLIVVSEAPDDLVDIAGSTFVIVHRGLDMVEGHAAPTTMAELRDRRRNLTVRPEMSGWAIVPATLALRRHADLFRLPLERSLVISGTLEEAFRRAAVSGLLATAAPYTVTVGA